MRRLCLTLITIAALTSSVSLADDDFLFNKREPRRNMLLINPGDLFHGVSSKRLRKVVRARPNVTPNHGATPRSYSIDNTP